MMLKGLFQFVQDSECWGEGMIVSLLKKDSVNYRGITLLNQSFIFAFITT